MSQFLSHIRNTLQVLSDFNMATILDSAGLEESM